MRTPHHAKHGARLGLFMVVVGAVFVVAPNADALILDREQPGNLTCEAIVAPLGLSNVVEVKDDHQREAPFPDQSGGPAFHTYTDGGVTISYRFVSALLGDGFVIEFVDASAPIYGYQVKQASTSQDVSRHGVYPVGVTSGSIAFSEGQFSNLKFCTGERSITTTTESTTTTSEGTTTTQPGSTTTIPVTTSQASTTTVATTSTSTSTSPSTTAPQVQGDDITPTTVEVLPDVVEVTTLPTTGAGTRALTWFGLALIALGAVLTGVSSHRLATHAGV